MADRTQAASVLATPKTRTPGPGAQPALSLMPHQHTRPGDRTIPLDQDSQGTPTQIEEDPPRVKQTHINDNVTAGCSLRDVQFLAGRQSTATTERYIDGDTRGQRKLLSLL